MASAWKLVEIEEAISKLPKTWTVYDVKGLTDALIISKFHFRRELSKFTKSLPSLSFSDRPNTHVVLTTVKEDLCLQ